MRERPSSPARPRERDRRAADPAREAYEGALEAEETRGGARLFMLAIAGVLWLWAVGWYLAFRGTAGESYTWVIALTAVAATVSLLPAGWRQLLLAWLPVLSTEWLSVWNVSVLGWVVPPLELAFWVLAGVVTVRQLLRAPGPDRLRRPVAVGVGAVLVLAGVWAQNWSILHPESYLAVHRGGFDAVARLVDEGRAGTSTVGYGDHLPRPLRDLATTGTTRQVLETSDGVVMLPEASGITGSSVGYLYVPPDAAPPPGARHLSGRWWWGHSSL